MHGRTCKETPPDLSSEAAHALVIASHTHRERQFRLFLSD